MTSETAGEFVEWIHGPAFATSVDGTILAWNQHASRLLGLSRSEAVGMNLEVLLSPLLARSILAAVSSSPEVRICQHGCFHKRPDGQIGCLDFEVSKVGGTPGQPSALIFIPRQGGVTELPRADQLDRDRMFEAVIHSINEAFVIADEHFRLVHLNQSAAEMFGLSPAEVVGKLMEEIAPLAGVLSLLKSPVPENHCPPLLRRFPGHRPDGRAFPIEATTASVTVHGQRLLTAILRDVSQQQQMGDALVRTQKMQALGTLASGIAHDFNNIFTAIISHLDLIASAPDLPPALREFAMHAQTGARRGTDVVSKLQAFSRHTETKMAFLDLSSLVSEVLFIMRHSLGRSIQINEFRLENPVGAVFADAGQMMQVLVNLCLNARDAMPDGGTLSISLEQVRILPEAATPPRKQGDFAKITVSDTGGGMSPAVLSRLFEPYFTTKEMGKGAGLGLSIASSVVTEHGGWIEADSRVGAGSHFHIFLPCRLDPSLLPVCETSEPLVEDSRVLEGNEKVLVVDDEDSLRLVIRSVLTYRGYQVVEAADANDALEKYRNALPPFDVVLMDVNMPVANGWTGLEEILKLNPKARVILLSGGFTEAELEKGARLGAMECLLKPFHGQSLIRLMRRVLTVR